MTRVAITLAALAAFAIAVPLSAQKPEAAASADEALQCAIWASYFSVEFQDEPEGDAFAYALNYFVGRYEGLIGKGIDTAIDSDLVTKTASDLDALTPVCTARMEEYGTRMVDWGKALNAIGGQIQPNAAQTS